MIYPLRRFCLALLLVAFTAPALAQSVPGHKNGMFAYPKTLSSEDGGAYRVIDYNEMRDINGRDKVPGRQVESRYVSLGVRRQQQDLVAATSAGNVAHYAVGRLEGARIIVIYIHGQGGNRGQGVNDYSFGGNFNRVKNLVVKGGGLYLSPDFADFGSRGAAQIRGLIDHYAAASPRAPVVVACGSAGGALCWRLAQDPAVVARLGGLMLLGSVWNDNFFASPAFQRRVPVFLAQGSADPVFSADRMKQFYRAIRARAPGYPVRMVRFETGNHGTPIRMTDWREAINWMMSAR